MITECVGKCSNHYHALEQAKSDCNDAVDSEIDLLVSQSTEKITVATKKAIKKAAKAIASGKLADLRRDTGALSDVVERSPFTAEEVQE